MLIRQHREWSVNSHCCCALCPIFGHIQNGRLHLFIRITERLLQTLAFFFCIRRRLLIWNLQILKLNQITVQPFAIRLSACICLFQFFIIDYFTFYRINQKHLSRMQSFFYYDLLWTDIQNTHFRRKNQRIIIRNIISGRTKPISVKNCSHTISITKQNRSRSVPRLHHGRIVLIEIFFLLRHTLVICPWFWNCDHYCKRQIHSTHHHKFNCIIKHC